MTVSEAEREQISRYLEGDLEAGEAQALEARMRQEPALDRVMADMRALRASLRALPTEMPAPAAPAVPVRARSWWPAVVLAAAALVMWIGWPRPHPVVVLTEGVTELDGDLQVQAAQVGIELRGRARVAVEPPAGVVRDGGYSQEESMDVRIPLSALAGAVVTVAVLEGSALVSPGDTPPVAVAAGESQAFGAASASTPASPLPDGARARAEALERQIAALQGQLDQTRQELAEEQFTGELARGQLAQLQGEPSAWPDEVPEAFTPEGFEDALKEQLEGIEDLEVAHLDCAEYPCIAALRYTGEGSGDAWAEQVGDTVGGWLESDMGDNLNLSVNRSRFQDGDNDAQFLVFGGHADGRRSNTSRRTEARIGDVVDTLGDNLLTEDEDVNGP